MKGHRFGRLTVLCDLTAPPHTIRSVYCLCECGALTVARAACVRNGNTTSCGCRRADNLRELAKKTRTHGRQPARLHRIWKAMKTRCYNPNYVEYRHYGGKGISICCEWQTFEGFREWALQNGYTETLSIDRRNNDAGYNPDNCRWATAEGQSQNTSRTKLSPEIVRRCRSEAKAGKSLSSLAREYGCDVSTLADAVNGRSWKNVH
jgi:hypothetical protein